MKLSTSQDNGQPGIYKPQAIAHICISNGPRREITCLQGFVKNLGVDQHTHMRRLVSAFVIHFLESIIPQLTMREIPFFKLVSVAEETGLSRALIQILKTGFVTSRPKYEH